MLVLFYGCLVVGLALLIADITGRLTPDLERQRLWRVIGIVAASGPGLGPILWLALAGREVTPSGAGFAPLGGGFVLVAAGYFAAYVVFLIGVTGAAGAVESVRLRRGAYLALLVLAAAPSFVLLALAPLVALAGLALAHPATASARSR